MITSLSNSRVKRAAALCSRAKARREDDAFVAEGIKLFLEAPKSWIREVYVSASFLTKYKNNTESELMDALSQTGYEVVSDEIFAKISDTQTPQGILSVLNQPHYNLYDAMETLRNSNPLFVILEDIQDPGNLGTILRVCEGAGVDGVIMSKKTVDIFNPKVIRSTMGSVYRVPFFIVEEPGEAIELLKCVGVSVYAAALEESIDYDEADYTKPTAFLIGNEASGLKRETIQMAAQCIRIPMAGQVESLNAAIATSVLVYEAARVRKFSKVPKTPPKNI